MSKVNGINNAAIKALEAKAEAASKLLSEPERRSRRCKQRSTHQAVINNERRKRQCPRRDLTSTQNRR